MANRAILVITFLFGVCGMMSVNTLLDHPRKKRSRWIRPIASSPAPPNPTPRVIIGVIIVIVIIGLPLVGGIMAIIRSIMEMIRAY